MTETRRPIGKILLERQAVSARDLEEGLERQKRSGAPIVSTLTEQGVLSESDAVRALAEQYGVPAIDLAQACVDVRSLATVPREIAEAHRILPVDVNDDRILLAMANPDDRRAIDEIEFVTGKRVYPCVAVSAVLDRALREAYARAVEGHRFWIGPRAPEDARRRAGVFPETGPPPTVAAALLSDARLERAEQDELSDAFASVITELKPRPSDVPLPDLPSQHPRRTVLVVDDEPEVRRMLRRLFTDRGFDVIEADRGLLALKLVKERAPDLVVLDAMLPEVHGFDIAKRIRGSRKYGHIPIVMISAFYRGWRYAEDVKAAYDVAAFIEKPFKMADILAAVDRALARADGRDVPDAEVEASEDAERALAAGLAAYREGDIETAIGHLRRGIEVDPLAHRLHFHLGLLLGKRGQTFEAIHSLETALDTHPRHFPALKNLAVLYQKAGFRNQAIETWERALAHAPDDSTRQTIKHHLLGLL